ncbi:MAG TPA: sigma 54-interacting transcriptional regulator [Bryobacteraceae bacterium]|nr:sigma 54-interacting transcriptional regulator [Bryobacteraceae bacterium]
MQWSRLLIAVEAEELYRRFESYISTDLRAGQKLRAQHCLPEQTDLKLREYDTDAVIVIQPRFQDDLPAAVRRWKSLRPDLQVLFCFRRLPKTRSLVELMRSGAFDVMDTEIEAIREPVIQEVLRNLQRRLEEVRIGSYEREQARNSLAEVGLMGESMEMQNLFMQIQHAARLTCPALVTGEPGTGKRLVAHAIHALGRRAGNQIATVDCLSLSPALLSAALFGHTAMAANANSGHGTASPGRGPVFIAAEHGTLLLNEISNIPPAIQAQLQKLLEAAESGGPSDPDVRILSTSSRRMDQLVETRHFRADLCYRLNVLPIEIPPLRRHLQDLPLLCRYFLSRMERDGRSLNLSDEATVVMNRYHWPGNIRELKEALEYAAARSVDDTILPSHLPETLSRGGGAAEDDEPFASSELNLARLERQAILRALQTSGFDKAKAARLLGIGKTTMYRKLKEMSGKK